jgi:F-type H+-transporting ATPase subunit b
MEAEHAAGGFNAAEFFSDPHSWAGVGLLIFVVIMVILKVPGALTKSLDDRAARIGAELASAEALRKEAEAKLAEAAERQKQAETDAMEIVEAARREAAAVGAQAQASLVDKLARREKLAEERIARAEADAMRDVKLAAIDTASKAAAQILTETLVGKAADDHFATSLETVKKALAS